jgi:hypothetical protein
MILLALVTAMVLVTFMVSLVVVVFALTESLVVQRFGTPVTALLAALRRVRLAA